jgi:hypothetical protein
MKNCRAVTFIFFPVKEMRINLTLFCLLMLLAIFSARAGLPRPYGGMVRLPFYEGEPVLDPARAFEYPDLLLSCQVHLPPLQMDEEGSFRPLLLVREPQASDDGRELKLDVLHQLVDQQGMSAEGPAQGLSLSGRDFIDSWHRLLDPAVDSPHWWLLAPVEGALEYARGHKKQITGLRLEHHLRVVIDLRYPLPQYREVLAALPLAPLSIAARSAQGAGRAGCGPFFISGGARLKYFDACPAGRPYLDQIELVATASEREAQMSFAAGRLHLVQAPWGAETFSSSLVWPVFLAYHPGLAGRLPEGLRQALEAALDRQALAAMGAPWGARPLYGLLEQAEEEVVPKPEAVMKAYLEKVSWLQRGVPPALKLLVRRGDELERVLAEKVQLQLMKIGLAVTLEEISRRDMPSRIKSGDYHFYFIRPYLPVRHPFLRLMGTLAYLASDRSQALQLVEELQKRWQKLAADQCQDKLCPELERSFRSRVPALALVRHGYAYRLAPALSGVEWRADGLLDFSGCWLQKE